MDVACSNVSNFLPPDVPAWVQEFGRPLGDSAAVSVSIESLTLASGDTITLPPAGVTAVVGGNNSGKSTLLRQITQLLTNSGGLAGERVRLLSVMSMRRSGTGADFVAWLAEHCSWDQRRINGEVGFTRPGRGTLSPQTAAMQWDHADQNHLSSMGPFLFHFADVQSRLGVLGGTPERSDVAEPPQHPLHAMQDDADLHRRLDGICRRVFRLPLTLDQVSGTMQLRVGRPDAPAPAVDESQRAYRDALAGLPSLQEQGDGMKSLLGLLLPIVTATYPIVIVDEPEAFLHPPQAFALGQALGELARDFGVQVVLATHDRNLLTGLLTSRAPLSVVRLNRQETTTRAAQLSADGLSELWADPILRYSNLLDGLFHQLVVLAEAEQDCRFYSAALEAWDDDGDLPVPANDVLFVPANGKQGLARLAAALRDLAVPVVASPDLDILDDETLLSRLVTKLGHNDWLTLKGDYDQATEPFRQPRQMVRAQVVRDAVDQVIHEATANDPDVLYSAALKEKVTAALRANDSPWQDLKRYGDRAFRGQSAEAAQRLLNALEQRGVVPVRVGELEGFAPALSKGKTWLPSALEAGAHRSEDVRGHVTRLLAARGT